MFGSLQPVTAYQRGVQDLIWSISPPHAADKTDEDSGEFQLPVISTDADLDKFLLDYFQITLPNTVCCSNHRTPWEAFHDAYFARAAIAVWKASRGFGGKSFLMALLSLVEGLTLRADVNILGGSGIQSKRILEAMAKLWKTPTAPRQALSSEPGGQKQTFTWGNTVTALMASQASVRGPHPQRLRMDEVDEMALDILDAALGQPMSKGWVQSHVVLSSTHQYADGTMTEILKRAKDKGWPFYEWCLAPDSMVATATGDRPISELQAGDLVWAFDGAQFMLVPANAVWSNGTKNTIRIHTEGGTIECTADHRILTENGWMRARELQAGSRVITGQRMRVRPTQAGGIKDLSAVLPAGDGQPEQTGPGPADNGAGNGPGWAAAVIPGSPGGRIADGAGPDLQHVVRGGPIRSGLLPVGSPGCGGMLRADSPEVQRGISQGYRPGSNHRSGGPTVDRAVRPGSASVVEVTSGRSIEVWDLSLPKHHAFLANGVVVHNCYRESMAPPNGWLHQAEVDRKRSILTVKMWDTEIEGQEPSSEGRAIETEQVEAAFQRHVPLEAPVPDKYVADLAVHVRGGRYASGADWAKKKNWTVVVTIRKDVRPMRVVAIKRVQREPWPKMAGYLNQRMTDYGGTSCHDNTGIGQVVHDLLDHESDPFNMVGQKRADLLSEYIAAIEKGNLVWPRDETNMALEAAYGEHKYATRDDVYKGSKDGTGTHHLPDTISAGALAWRAATITEAAGTSSAPPNPEETKNINKLAATMARMKAGLQSRQRTQPEPTPEPPPKPREAPVRTRQPWKRQGHDPGDGESK